MFVLDSRSAILGLWDPQSFPATGNRPNPSSAADLIKLSQTGEVFFVDSSAPATFSVEIIIDRELPEWIADSFEAQGGSFRLDVSSGELRFGAIPGSDGSDAIAVTPGDYVVTVLVPIRDAGTRDERMKDFVGYRELRFLSRLDQIGAARCLSYVLCSILLLEPATRPLWWLWLSLFSAPTLVHTIGRILPRYRRARARIRQFQEQLPHFVLVLHRRSRVSPWLRGGWLSI